MQHFARAIRGLEPCQSTGEDGKLILETIYAAYASAGLGRKVALPYTPTQKLPIAEWLSRREHP